MNTFHCTTVYTKTLFTNTKRRAQTPTLGRLGTLHLI